MICPGTQIECDNPGCRRGGCQGRLPQLPLFQAMQSREAAIAPRLKLYETAAPPPAREPRPAA